MTRYSDEVNYYLSGARHISEQGWTYFLTEQSLQNAPLTIIWTWLFGGDVLLIQAANSVLVTVATALLTIALARQAGPRLAILVGIVLSVYPPFLELSTTILSEPPFIFLMICGYYLWTATMAPACSGVLFGLACLTRPSILLLPPAILLVSILLKPVRRMLPFQQALSFAIGFYIVAGLYAGKNWIAVGEPVIAYGSGAVLYLGNDLKKQGDEPVYSGMVFDTYTITRPYSHLEKIGDARLVDAALTTIRTHPYDIAVLTVEKFFRLLFGYPSAYFYPYKHFPFLELFSEERPSGAVLTLQLLNVAVTIATALGLVLACIAVPWRTNVILSLLIAFYFLGIHSVLFAIPRMMAPAFPFLLVPAAYGYANASRKLRRIAIVLFAIVSVLMTTCGYNVNTARVHQSYLDLFTVTQRITPTGSPLVSKTHEGSTYMLVSVPEQAVLTNTVVFAAIESERAGIVTCARFAAQSKPGKRVSKCFTLDSGHNIYRVVLQPEELTLFDKIRYTFKSTEGAHISLSEVSIAH